MTIELFSNTDSPSDDDIGRVDHTVKQQSYKTQEQDLIKSAYESSEILQAHFKEKEFLEILGTIISWTKEHDVDCPSHDDGLSFDIMVQNERGITLFGIPFFSTRSLIQPLDPAMYTNIHGHAVSDLKLFPKPDLNWEWKWNRWYVLMTKRDMDDQGWMYSWRFSSSHWRGIYRMGCFVRRRLWIRLRQKNNKIDP